MKTHIAVFVIGAVFAGSLSYWYQTRKLEDITNRWLWVQSEQRMFETMHALEAYEAGEHEKAVTVLKLYLMTGIHNYEINQERLDALGYQSSLNRAQSYLDRHPLESIDN
ncbi:hypothetical protein MLD52_19975 [Puniceicoccaceae bacterium K14]|nr:hypothetical protein [Puniceicoccaceae bacterium K14]